MPCDAHPRRHDGHITTHTSKIAMRAAVFLACCIPVMLVVAFLQRTQQAAESCEYVTAANQRTEPEYFHEVNYFLQQIGCHHSCQRAPLPYGTSELRLNVFTRRTHRSLQTAADSLPV